MLRLPLTLFVSYSHRNESDKDRLLTHLSLLERQGLIGPWDDRQIIPSEEWQPTIQNQLDRADIILLLVSADFLNSSFCYEVELQRAIERHDAGQAKVVPIFIQPCDWKNAPFAKLQGLPKDAVPTASFPNPELGFSEVAKGLRRLIESMSPAPKPFESVQRSLISTDSRIIQHVPRELIGRENELDRLTQALRCSQTRLMSIVAWGGVGKTSIVAKWVADLRQEHWKEVDAYFDWSFYSQGTREQSNASADAFIDTALRHFGGESVADSNVAADDKGKSLAQLIARHRTVMILDGLEPLQFPPGQSGMDGRIKDPAISALLKTLAQISTDGLCVVTTREPITDLTPFHGSSFVEWNLDSLSTENGAKLLHSAGAKSAGGATIEPDDRELLDVSKEVRGHALTLQLLGRYLHLAHHGDIRRRDFVSLHKADPETQGGHAFRVIEAYESWFKQSSPMNNPAPHFQSLRMLEALRLVGLFDRPASQRCLGALRQPPTIAGLTDSLVDASDEEVNIAFTRLQEIGLIVIEPNFGEPPPGPVDAHPLIREFFARQIQTARPNAWKEANRRLYRYLSQCSEDEPETLSRMQPLYQAIPHGVAAGLTSDACSEVYRRRILRNDRRFATLRLGAITANLSALTSFFDELWDEPSQELSIAEKAWVLNEAAFHLLVLGRTSDARESAQRAVDFSVKEKNWSWAARYSDNLLNSLLTSGDLPRTVESCKLAIGNADRSGNKPLRLHTRCAFANALFQSGSHTDAERVFHLAEELQGEIEADKPQLHGFGGFQFCDFMLAGCERVAWQITMETIANRAMPDTFTFSRESAVLDALQHCCESAHVRAEQSVNWDKAAERSLLHVALNRLTLVRVRLYQRLIRNASKSVADSIEHSVCELVEDDLDSAWDQLSKTGQQFMLPLGRLTRSWIRFLQGNRNDADLELDEAWQIAERGQMGLHMADIQLTRARLFGDKGALDKAKDLIDKCAYLRRQPECNDAEAWLAHSNCP